MPVRMPFGDPLPEERAVLPRPDALAGGRGVGGILSPPTRVHACTRSTDTPDVRRIANSPYDENDDRAGLEPGSRASG